jgi:hypothetical protein
MSTVRQSNKAAPSRFHDAMNTGDAEHISKTIDEVVEPNVLIRTPLSSDATGAQALKHVWAALLRAFPDLAGQTGCCPPHHAWQPTTSSWSADNCDLSGGCHGSPSSPVIR